MAVSVVSFSFSRAAQPEAQRPSSLLDDGFLYCILSATGLQNSIGGPKGPFGQVWLSLPHLVSDISDPQLNWRPWGPEAWRGFPYHISSPSNSNSLTSVLTELYNSSTPTQSPTQSLEWHVWLSSSGNNCHAVQRSLSSGASVYECIMGFFFFALSHFISQILPTRFLSITGHWDVSLPSGASLWNGIFARIEGQNTTTASPHLPWSEPRLVIHQEHHQHDLLQHQSQPDRRHLPSIRRAPAFLWKKHAPSSGSVSRRWLRLKVATLNRCQLYYIIKLPELIFSIKVLK